MHLRSNRPGRASAVGLGNYMMFQCASGSVEMSSLCYLHDGDQDGHAPLGLARYLSHSRDAAI